MAQDALNRWWWLSLMMFGPPGRQFPKYRTVDALAHQARDQ